MSIDKLTELVIAAKKKDNGAISMLYEQTHQRIYFSVLMIIKNEQDALDIMQETYISAIRKLASLKNPEAFEGWLHAIARNKCLNFLKKHKELLIDDKEEHLFEQIKDTSDEFLPAEALENKEMQEVILESVKSLPVKLSQTVMYYYFDEMTTIEIASLMSCPTSTVSRRLAAARDRIKKDLEGKKGVFTIMPLPILTNIFKQAIKENTKWMVSAQQSATCLEGIFAGIHLSTGSIIVKAVKNAFLTSTGKSVALSTVVIAIGTATTVFFLSNQDLPYEPNEASRTSVSSVEHELTSGSAITYPSEITEISTQTTYSEATPDTDLTSLTQVIDTGVSTSVTSDLEQSTITPEATTTPSTINTESLTRVNGILIKKLDVLDETYSDIWSIKYGFSEDKLIFSDRNFTFVRLPDFMGNLERIQLACDSKFSQKDVAKFIAGDEITVYIGMDSRAVAKGPPAWMDSWSLDNDTAFLSNDVTFIFYKKDFNKGEEVILGTNGDPLSVIMYTVFVSPKAIH